jgi:hypothetical protein
LPPPAVARSTVVGAEPCMSCRADGSALSRSARHTSRWGRHTNRPGRSSTTRRRRPCSAHATSAPPCRAPALLLSLRCSLLSYCVFSGATPA